MEIAAGLVALGIALVIAAALLSRRPAAGDGAGAAQQATLQQIEALRSQMGQSLEAVTGRMLELERALHGQVLEVQRNVNDGLEKATAQLGTVQQSLVRTNELVKQVEEAGKEMAALQDILRPPKLRGQLGELLLGQVLRQVLPDGCFQEQYEFPRSRVRVDAVIMLSGGMVPVDSKFPMESCQRLFQAGTDDERRRCRAAFLRDVRSHVDAIASKYILTDEGTFDFALMYIPAENLYYEIIAGGAGDDGIYSYALGRKVVPVSPNSFYAYLQAVALGLKGLRIERNAQQIMAQLGQLGGELGKFQVDFETLGRHLANAHTKYEDADKRLARFGDRLQSLAGAGALQAGDTPVLPLRQDATVGPPGI
ncbi:MAG: DNA recombination protein RmuC [Chloroflexi bacterium]|nr:DNA recombination protein RmuC [Chloroflexota bacterium]